MGDIEGYWRKKEIKKPRDHRLSDHENSELHRPYCGNPFIGPGTLGSKAQKKNQRASVPSDEAFLGDFKLANEEN